MKYPLILVVLLGLCFISCERDDICSNDVPTTPSIIIRFYDVTNPNVDTEKQVVNLRIQGVGNSEVLPDYNIVATDSITIPLKTNDTITEYRLHKEYVVDDNDTEDDTSDDIVKGNEDIITISYNMEHEFVSRACGYKTIYNNVSINLVEDDNNWIQLIRAVNDNQSVEDENQQHFKIYH
ncbi:DUF6452 family protein [Formosa sp. S-31]|uniref:DUF6452 family protein n=1 Tax=Formosa sp. S-31 TaxID=2790949 RepID=UPI003EC0AF8D